MSQAETPTAEGYLPPINTQFSVFLANRVGRLAELLEVFQGHAIELAGVSIVDAADHAVARVLTSNAALAARLLKRHEMPSSEAEILVVEIRPEQDQSLLRICTSLMSAEINIAYAYPLMVLPHGHSAIALHTDDNVLAGQILRRKLFVLLGENDLGDNATEGDPFDRSY
jgi:hypothetical protein